LRQAPIDVGQHVDEEPQLLQAFHDESRCALRPDAGDQLFGRGNDILGCDAGRSRAGLPHDQSEMPEIVVVEFEGNP